MKRREWGERWSFVWLAIVTVVIVSGAFLISDTLKDKAVEEIFVAVEHFEKGNVQAPVTKSEQHTEELETGVLVNEETVDLLARLIRAECGDEWCTDELQLATGSVVLNRMNDSRFPNTIPEVIYQRGQYSTVPNGEINKPYNERTYANAKYLLENGSTIPENVVFQANFRQGSTYKVIQGVYFGR